MKTKRQILYELFQEWYGEDYANEWLAFQHVQPEWFDITLEAMERYAEIVNQRGDAE